MNRQRMRYTCSFCGKGQEEVRRLIGGWVSDAFICDECVALCNVIIGDEPPVAGARQGERRAAPLSTPPAPRPGGRRWRSRLFGRWPLWRTTGGVA